MDKQFHIRERFVRTDSLAYFAALRKHNSTFRNLLSTTLTDWETFAKRPGSRALLNYPWLKWLTKQDKPKAFRRLATRLIWVLEKTHLLHLLEEEWSQRWLESLIYWDHKWLREPENWKPTSKSSERAANALSAFLLTEYPVPPSLQDSLLRENGDPTQWYIDLGQGKSIRSLENVPIPITKKMAHLVRHAPRKFSFTSAMNWAFVRAEGGNKKLARYFAELDLYDDHLSNELRVAILRFVIREGVTDLNEVSDVIDFTIYQSSGYMRPNKDADYYSFYLAPDDAEVSFKGVTAASMRRKLIPFLQLRQTIWDDNIVSWKGTGIADFKWENESGTQYWVSEITEMADLSNEGEKMGHCVATYNENCFIGQCAIFSLKVLTASGRWRRLATIEVNRKTWNIDEFKMRFNADPDEETISAEHFWRKNWLLKHQA